MNQDESYKNRVVGLKKDLIQGGQFWLTRGRSGGEEEAGPEFMVGTNANYQWQSYGLEFLSHG